MRYVTLIGSPILCCLIFFELRSIFTLILIDHICMRIDKTSAAFSTFARPVPFYFLEVRTNGKAPNFSTELGSL